MKVRFIPKIVSKFTTNREIIPIPPLKVILNAAFVPLNFMIQMLYTNIVEKNTKNAFFVIDKGLEINTFIII